MTRTRNILVFMGTRPEAVKLAPVVAALRGVNDFRCTVVATGQHTAETFGFCGAPHSHRRGAEPPGGR